jgi:precorrin-6Y C5,15-methyltransferase (decarboxylating)
LTATRYSPVAEPAASDRNLPPLDLVGLHGGESFGAAGREALERADVIIGARRHLDRLSETLRAERIPVSCSVGEALASALDLRKAGRRVCFVTSGDPGFFGLARLASVTAGSGIRIHPAPSSIAIAFGRLGIPWDDATVISLHGRCVQWTGSSRAATASPGGATTATPPAAIEAIVRNIKTAVLTSPEFPPESLGAALVDAGCPPRRAVVLSRLGEPEEALWEGDLRGLASGRFDPLSVVVLLAPDRHPGPNRRLAPDRHPAPDQGHSPDPGPGGAVLAWGLPDQRYAHRAGMITKSEVRAVAISKLCLPPQGVLWDVGSGSGALAAECAALAPGLRVFAIERSGSQLEFMRQNLDATNVEIVVGEAPAAFEALPDPDRVFVGGGGLDVLDAALRRLLPGGTLVANYASLDRAVAAAARLGRMVQVAVSRAVPTAPADQECTEANRLVSLRFEANNPVFVCWGPTQ